MYKRNQIRIEEEKKEKKELEIYIINSLTNSWIAINFAIVIDNNLSYK